MVESFDPPVATTRGDDRRNRLIAGDNLAAMDALLPDSAGAFDLIYLDPPFNTGRDWTRGTDFRAADRAPVAAFSDRAAVEDYLQFLWVRLHRVRDLLSDRGSLVLHVNWRVSHLAQLLLDELFGPGDRAAPGSPGFRAEVVWGFGGGGSCRSNYTRKHDNLLWYTRGSDWIFHPVYRPYSPKTLKRGLTAAKGPAYRLRGAGASPRDWWTDDDVQKILSPTARENLKYPTQKPEAVLERILRGHTDADSLVGDFFCGSGTTGAVAERLGRPWVMADCSDLAIATARDRLRRRIGEVAAARPFDLLRVVAGGEGAAGADAEP